MVEGNGNLALAERTSSNQFLTSAMTANDVMAQVQLVQDVMGKVMRKDEHYGIIPGCKKPSLYKPGAEKLCLLFRLNAQFDTIEHYDGAHYTVKSKCTLIHITSGQVIGSGEGLCSSKEKKYAYRKDGKPNENLPDVYNTILKMANKRALVAATLVSTAASDIFTQDVEDMPTVLIDADAAVKPAAAAPVGVTRKLKPEESKLHPPGEETAVPTVVPDTDGERVTVLKVATKNGEKNGKPWTRYGISVRFASGEEDWLNTFSSTFGELAQQSVGSQLLATFDVSEYNGKPQYNLTNLVPA